MAAPDPLSNEPTELDDELVAYLDGELEPADCRRIEELLARDDRARSRLRALERTWDALDELPRTTLDESFTRSTVEMIAVKAERDADQLEENLVRRRGRWLLGIGGAAAAALVGFALVRFSWPDPNRRLLEDLPVLEHLDEYSQVQDIDFLRQLAQENLFAAEDS
ncbi:MAG: hypothetical protein JNG90_07095, partial [Planctomycetaceae bacterium]|nr:hypothetical protein [Planctomycetaceae bacterium]